MPKSDPTAVTPKQHIDRLFSEMATETRNSRTLANTLNAVIETSLTGKHQFIYELFQNADDAGFDEGVSFEFTLIDDQYLIFSHNGRHFSPEDVDKICDIAQQGYGSKANDLNATGYKDIGFKSVFMPASAVTVLSKNYTFRFDKGYEKWSENPSNYPWPIIPIWTEPKDLPNSVVSYVSDSTKVHFILKLKPGNSMSDELKFIYHDLSIFLFLRRMKSIQINHVAQRVVLLKQKIELIKNDNRLDVYLNGELDTSWLTKRFDVEVGENVRKSLEGLSIQQCPPRLREAKQSRIAFAAKLEGNKICSGNSYNLYSYLPTRTNCGLPFIVNGDFLLNIDRSHLEDNQWNSYLFQQIGYLHVRWLAELAADATYRMQILKLMGPTKVQMVPESCQLSYLASFKKGRKEIAFLPSNGGRNLLRLNQVAVDQTGFFYQFQADFENNLKLIAQALENYMRLSEHATELGMQIDFPGLFERIPNLMKNADLKKQLTALNFLQRVYEEKYKLRDTIKQLEFIPTNYATIARASEVYFPTNNPIPSGIQLAFISPQFLYDESNKSFLRDIGIREVRRIELIRGYVVSLIESGGITSENIIPITQLIYDAYVESELSKLDSLKLQSMPVLTTTGKLIPVNRSYLSESYLPTRLLQKKFPKLDVFISPQYIKPGASPQSWKEFFIVLGAANDIKFRLFNNCSRSELSTFPRMQKYLEYLRREENITSLGYQKWRELKDLSIENFLVVDFIDNLVDENYAGIFWELIAKEWQKILNISSRIIYHGMKSIPIKLTYMQFIVKGTFCKNSSGKNINIGNLFAPSLTQYIGLDMTTMPVAIIDHVELTLEQEKYFGFKTELTVKECLEILNHLNSLSVSLSLNRYSAILKYLVSLGSTLIPADKESIKLWKGFLPARDNTLQRTHDLIYLNVPILGSAGYTRKLLKRFPKLTTSEMSKLSEWFRIREFQVEQLVPMITGPRLHDEPKERLYSRLAVIAYSEALQRGEKNPNNLLKTLYERLRSWTFISATRILLDLGNAEGPPVKLHTYQNTTYFINFYNSEGNKALFSEAIHQILGLSIELRDLQPLIYLNDYELNDWYQEQAIDVKSIKYLKNEIYKWLRTNSFNSSASHGIPETDIPSEPNNLGSPLTVLNTESTDVSSIVNVPSPIIQVTVERSKEKEHEVVQKADSKNTNNRTPVNINRQNDSTRPETQASSHKIVSYFTFKPSTKVSAKPKLQTVTLDAYMQHYVGLLGESTVFSMLKKHYQAKYPSLKFTETTQGFTLSGINTDQNSILIEVQWCNKTTESGKPYDFMIKRNGKKDRVIEVKATSSADKEEFEVSHQQWTTMHKLGNRFRFFRVFDTGQEDISITKIKNPAELLKRGKIQISDLKIKI